jgi:hypothetical protein
MGGDHSFSGVMVPLEGSMVFAGGEPDFDPFVEWRGTLGGLSGTLATMSTDGCRVISAIDNRIRGIDNNGQEIWTRNEGALFRAESDREFLPVYPSYTIHRPPGEY